MRTYFAMEPLGFVVTDAKAAIQGSQIQLNGLLIELRLIREPGPNQRSNARDLEFATAYAMAECWAQKLSNVDCLVTARSELAERQERPERKRSALHNSVAYVLG